MYACACTHTFVGSPVQVGKLEENFPKLDLFFWHMDPRTNVNWAKSQVFFLPAELSHWLPPQNFKLKIFKYNKGQKLNKLVVIFVDIIFEETIII